MIQLATWVHVGEKISVNGPLSGVRILDLSRVLSGPAATMLLADQGADVIKVEPLDGDITRQMGKTEADMSAVFLNTNRGKRSIAVDLKTPEGITAVKRLAADADVFVQNFRPGTIERMGLGEDVIRAIKTDILYISISGFGEAGPYAHQRVYDPVIQALSGITDVQADDSGRPRMIRTVIPDKTTALTAAQAITAALFGRARTGAGQHVKIAMLDAMIAYLWPEGMAGLTVVGDEKDMAVGQIAPDLVFQTEDGYITAGVVSDKEWEGLCAALEQPQWLRDKRYKDTASRLRHGKARLAETAEVLATRTSEEWLKRLDEHGVPCAPVLTRPEVIEHAQVQANALISEYDHPLLGRVRQPRAAARFEGAATRTEPLAPRLGQHNREVLGEIGYGEDEIADLEQRGILGSAA